jgi:hypothetical protein
VNKLVVIWELRNRKLLLSSILMVLALLFSISPVAAEPGRVGPNPGDAKAYKNPASTSRPLSFMVSRAGYITVDKTYIRIYAETKRIAVSVSSADWCPGTFDDSVAVGGNRDIRDGGADAVGFGTAVSGFKVGGFDSGDNYVNNTSGTGKKRTQATCQTAEAQSDKQFAQPGDTVNGSGSTASVASATASTTINLVAENNSNGQVVDIDGTQVTLYKYELIADWLASSCSSNCGVNAFNVKAFNIGSDNKLQPGGKVYVSQRGSNELGEGSPTVANFGLRIGNVNNNDPNSDGYYTDYNSYFGPPCGTPANSNASILVYDDDNDGTHNIAQTTGRPFLVRLEEAWKGQSNWHDIITNKNDFKLGPTDDLSSNFKFEQSTPIQKNYNGQDDTSGGWWYVAASRKGLDTTSGGQYRISFKVDPNKRYRFRIAQIDKDNNLQFQIPFPGFWGADGVTCPSSNDNIISPSVNLDRGEYEPGALVKASAFVNKSKPSIAESSYNRTFWYENGTDQVYNANGDPIVDTSIQQKDESKQYVGNSPYALGEWSTTIPQNPNLKRVCTALKLFDPVSGTTIDEPPRDVECANIVRKPYFKATLGDVNAAAGWGSSCGASNGKISAFNSGAAGGFKGSGAQVAAFSAGIISQFTSGIPAKGLTFANTLAANNPYGGGFEHTYCIPDYLQGVTASNSPNVPCSSDNVITNGDVFVSANCANVANVGVGNVPNLRWVIAKNIYIGKNVRNLDGIYIAKENIYTCGESLGNVVKLPDLATQCDKQLTVRGALVAGGIIKLQRTYQSLLQNPAEVIEYNPFVWLSAINSPPDPTRTTHKFDYITALPPVL